MAEIQVNGGLRIIPTKPPRIVSAHRALGEIEAQIRRFHGDFRSAGNTFKDLRPLQERSVALKRDYIAALQNCESVLNSEVTQMSVDNKAYFEPVLIFISRAKDAHTVVPFEKYLDTYVSNLEVNELGGNSSVPLFKSPSEMRAFIEERIEESISTCRAYACLLSNSLDSAVSLISLDSMIARILKIQSTISRWNNCAGEEHFKEQYAKNVRFENGHAGSPTNIEPLVYFILEHAIGNAFKASFGAAGAQIQQGRSDFFSTSEEGAAYKGIPFIQNPSVTVALGRKSETEISVTVSDNGIGIPGDLLPVFFSGNDYKKHARFTSFQPSNNSSVRLFPFLADLTGIHMHITSNVGKGTTIELTIPVSLNGT